MPEKRSNISVWFSALAILISLLAVYISYTQKQLQEKLSYQHIKPDVKVFFDYHEEGTPDVIFKNESPINIVSLSISHQVFVFGKKGALSLKSIAFTGNNEQDFRGHTLVFKDRIEPKKTFSTQSLDVKGTNQIVAYYFYITFFRETDMEKFEKEAWFFIEDNELIEHSAFLKSKYYKEIMLIIKDKTYKDINIR